MAIPKCVTDTIALLRQERAPVAARLDAIDLAIDNLTRVWGVHGVPQALPLERRQKERRVPRRAAATKAAPGDGAALKRREILRAVIHKAPHGITLGDLRKQTAAIDGKDRSNALQQLKVAGEIVRVGNTWAKPAPAEQA